jgi:hypothetical protein
MSKRQAKYCYSREVKEGSNMLKAHLLVAYVSLFSMVLQPVAYGQAQKNWAAQALSQYVKDNQKLGRKITVKEFWEKNKSKLHPDWQRKLFPSIELQKNERLPQMDVITVKGPGGQNTARMVITLPNKKTVSVEILNGEGKFARINNQVVSYEDIYSGEKFYEKLAQDSVVQGEMARVENLALNSSMLPNYRTFVRMTPRERAVYFVNMRIVLQAAAEVNRRAFEASQKKESASFINLLLEKAYAASNDPSNWVGKRCIVAGYVGTYTKDSSGHIFCDHEQALKAFEAKNTLNGRSSKTSQSATDGSCGAGNLRCNPFVYGFQRSGGASLCVKIGSAPSFQQATRTCDSASPLRKESLASDTEAMIKTLLEKEGKNGDSYFKDGKVISEAKYKELTETVAKDFNTFIDDALNTCKDTKNIDGTTSFGEKFQGDACSVLRERKIAFDEGFKGLIGKYDTPTPTPAPVITQPVVSPETQCKIEGTQKPGYYDSECICIEEGKGIAGANGKPTIKDGKCVKVPVGKTEGEPCDLADGPETRGKIQGGVCVPLVPATVSAAPCNNDPQMTRSPDSQGKMQCVPIAAAIQKTESRKPAGKKAEKDCGMICIVPLILLGGLAISSIMKSKQKNKPGEFIPNAPGPLPAAPPQPTPVVPVPPIIPSLPIPNPAGSETSPSALPSPTIGTGTR